MASIGLRVDHGSAGTELANTLAKALLGDPRDEFYAASVLSNIKVDEEHRRRLAGVREAEAAEAARKRPAIVEGYYQRFLQMELGRPRTGRGVNDEDEDL